MGFQVQKQKTFTLAAAVPTELADRFKIACDVFGVSQKVMMTQMIQSCLDDLADEIAEKQAKLKQKEAGEGSVAEALPTEATAEPEPEEEDMPETPY